MIFTVRQTPRRGYKLIAQGIALGIDGKKILRPVRAKALYSPNWGELGEEPLLPLQGEFSFVFCTQGDALG